MRQYTYFNPQVQTTGPNNSQRRALALNSEQKTQDLTTQPQNVYNAGIEQISNNANRYNAYARDYVLNSKNKYLNPNNHYQLYNPVIEEQYASGVFKDRLTRFTTHYLNIDSSFRNKTTQITQSHYITLNNNPLSVTEGSKEITVNYPNHDLKVNDKIMLKGVSAPTFKLFYGSSMQSIIFNEGSNYAAILGINHGLTQNNQNLTCTISEFTNPPDNLLINNIALSFINNTHLIILSLPNETFIIPNGSSTACQTILPDRFYIKLPYAYNLDDNYPLSTDNRWFSLNLNYQANIPINYLNAAYPNSSGTLEGIYHIVQSITENSFTFNLLFDSVVTNNAFGGSTIRISKVENINYGYPSPSEYTIKLNSILKNVVEISVDNIIIPNTFKNVTENNNKFNWQNYDVGNSTYSVTIPPGYYDAESLKETLEKLISDTPRKFYFSTAINQNRFINQNLAKFDINLNTGITKIQMFKKYIATNALCGIYAISNTEQLQPLTTELINASPDLIYPVFILIHFKQHRLNLSAFTESGSQVSIKEENKIVLENFGLYHGLNINNSYIPYQLPNNASSLGAEFSNEDYFLIQLPLTNILNSFTDSTDSVTFGTITVPELFRPVFTDSNTIGELLGFDTGENATLPDFAYLIESNNNNLLKFNNNNYILLVCDQIQTMTSLTNVKSAMAKIYFKRENDNFNNIVYIPQLFFNLINEIFELSFSFQNPDGTLYDMGNLNHSFVLKIVTIDSVQYDANISSKTGQTI